MTSDVGTLDAVHCPACQGTFTRRPGLCPRCGQGALEPIRLPAEGVVLAATALEVPAAGWPSPHRIALVEAAQGLRLIGAVEGEVLPALGAKVLIRQEKGLFRIAP